MLKAGTHQRNVKTNKVASNAVRRDITTSSAHSNRTKVLTVKTTTQLCQKGALLFRKDCRSYQKSIQTDTVISSQKVHTVLLTSSLIIKNKLSNSSKSLLYSAFHDCRTIVIEDDRSI